MEYHKPNFVGTIQGEFTSGGAPFQTNSTNGNTLMRVLPNGTAVISEVGVYNNSNTTNAGFMTMRMSTAAGIITVGRNGTGSFLPLNVVVGDATWLTVSSTNRNVLMAGSAASSLVSLTVDNPSATGVSGGSMLSLRSTNSANAQTTFDIAKYKSGLTAFNSYDPVGVITFACNGQQKLSMSYLAGGSVDIGGYVVVDNTNVGTLIDLRYGGVGRGSITTNGSTVAYNTTSDYRLKTNVRPLVGAVEQVCKIRPYLYDWIAGGLNHHGVLAHELQEVVPHAVLGVKDGDEMQQVDYSKLVPLLIAAVQELYTQVAELKEMVDVK